MFPSPDVRQSVDSLASPPPGIAHRSDFPFHKQHPRQRRESTASSVTVTSIGGSLDTAFGVSWQDAVHESSQNAISTLLQPPIVRTGLLPHTSAPAHSAHKPPTAKDIPPVPLTNIPHVEISEFRAYLAQVGALHEQLRRVQESEDEQQQQQPAASGLSPLRRNSSKEDFATGTNDGLLRPGTNRAVRRLSVSSVSSLSLNDGQSPVRRSSSSYLSRRANQGPPPLSTIPDVYFDEDFHLENPRTFDIVSERSEVVPSSTTTSGEKAKSIDGTEAVALAPRKALATNAILQEKLSWYMDTVEMHLISSISTASTAFFTALGSLKELHTEAADSVERIKALRAELGALDEEIATRGLVIVQKQRDRQNMQQLHAAVMQLRDIVDDVSACEKLVDDGEVETALDCIACLERLIAGEQDMTTNQREKRTQQSSRQPRPYALQDLRGATALQGVQDDIATLRFRIGKAYEAKFVATLIQDLRRHIETVPRREVLMRWNSAAVRARGGHSREPSVFPAYLASTDALRMELLPMVAGLHRARHIAAATQVYRESVMREIRNLIRRPLPSSNDEDNESMMSSSTLGNGRQSQQEKSIVLARNLRALEPEDAEELLMTIYISVTETLRRMTTQAKVLLDVASSVGLDSEKTAEPMSPPFSPSGRPIQQPLSASGLEAQGELHKALDLSNFTGQAVDVVQEKMVKILRVRSEQSAHLSLILFLRYFTLNLHFANECEAISGRSGTALKTAVNGQIKTFVQNNGNSESQQLAQEMESDQWTAKDFTDQDNALLQAVLQASTKDAEVWTADIQLWTPPKPAVGDSDEGKTASGTTAGAGAKAETRSAAIDEESFLLPTSAVLCLQGIERFMRLTVAIPFMTTDVASSLVQYLQLFNSRCTQLILFAGARRSAAGLKNITTRHLAIASQALAFLAALVPYMREFIRRRVASTPGGGSGAAGSVSGLMGEFDRVRRLYQEHQNNIYDKLVEIMGGRAAVHARAMQAIDWDADMDGTVHAYMEALAKETTTLHRNLAKTLSEGTVLFIMAPVFSGYVETLGGVLRAAEVTTQNGKNSMLRDIDYFEARLSKIGGFGNSGRDLRAIVTDKVIRPPTPPPPPPPPPDPEPEPKPEPKPELEPEPERGLAPVVSAAEELVKDEDIKDEDVKDEDVKDEDAKDKVAKDKDVKDEDVKDEDVKDEDVKDEDVKGEDVKDEDVKDEDVKDEDVKDEDVKDEDVKDEDVKDEDVKDEDVKGKDAINSGAKKDAKNGDAKGDARVGDAKDGSVENENAKGENSQVEAAKNEAAEEKEDKKQNDGKDESTLPPAPPPKEFDSSAVANTSKAKGKKPGGRNKRASSSAQSKKDEKAVEKKDEKGEKDEKKDEKKGGKSEKKGKKKAGQKDGKKDGDKDGEAVKSDIKG